MHSPAVSIVVPFYNYPEFLRECLVSVQSQTFVDWEVIVVDDGSTKGDAQEIVTNIRDPRIRLIQHDQNKGLAAARNTGFSAAAAPLLLSLDADDMLAPTYLEKVGAVLESDSRADCAFPDFKLFGAWDQIVCLSILDTKAMTHHTWIPGSGTLMRRKLWSSLGGYCEAPELRAGMEDWDFWLSAVERGITVLHVPEPLYLWRQHSASMRRESEYQNYRIREFLYQRHRALFDQFGTGNQFRAEGYLVSATAARQRSELRRTVQMVVKAWSLLDGREEKLSQMMEALLPSVLLSLWNKFRRFYKWLVHTK